MTTDDYITTTGERWSYDDDCDVVFTSNSEGRLIVTVDIFAELRALRAQRDELLAALEGLDRHEAMACIVEPPCGDCRACNARATLRRAKGEA